MRLKRRNVFPERFYVPVDSPSRSSPLPSHCPGSPKRVKNTRERERAKYKNKLKSESTTGPKQSCRDVKKKGRKKTKTKKRKKNGERDPISVARFVTLVTNCYRHLFETRKGHRTTLTQNRRESFLVVHNNGYFLPNPTL